MKNRKWTQWIIGLIFAALLVVPYLMQHDWGGSDGSASVAHDKAMQRYGFYLEEVSEEVGIRFEHQAPELDPKLDHIMKQIASVGASVSVADFNNDGWQDIYLTSSAYGAANALYRNNGDGTFTDVAESLGVADVNREGTGVSMGTVWGDYNNDGFEDLFLYKWGKPELYRNEGGEQFTRVTGQAGFPDWINANSAIWFDYDRDGLLDLFIGGYYHEKHNLWDLETTRIMPDNYEYATNGGRNYLMHNLGNGRFEEVSKKMGIDSRRWTLSSSSVDLTGSGYPDLVVANDYGVDELFINREGNRFESIGRDAGLGFSPKSGMNVSYGDILNRGKYAVYITNISEPGILMQGNNLWMPVEAGKDSSLTRFRNMAGNLGIELSGWSYSAQFGDINNDGLLDLYVANGFISGDKGTDYWYDYSKISGGYEDVISDAENWPAMEGRSHSGYQRNHIWLNDGAGRFQEVGAAVGGNLELDSRAVAMADLWNRGRLDIIVATQRGPARIYRNEVTGDYNWIAFALKGTASNTSAIGAEVELFWNGTSQVQTVSGGSGFSSQNQRPVHFGLGESDSVEKVIIRWPSGRQQQIKPPGINRLHRITETSKESAS